MLSLESEFPWGCFSESADENKAMSKQSSFFLQNLNLIDVDKGRVLCNASLRIEEGKIASFGVGILPQKSDKKIDCKGAYALPGLIDAHCHLFGNGVPSKAIAHKGKGQDFLKKLIPTWIGKAYLHHQAKASLQQALYAGITTVRALGDIRYSDIWAKKKMEAGSFLGPRLLTSGYAVTTPDGHGVGTISIGCATYEEYDSQIEKNAKEGCDWIKIMATSGVMDATDSKHPGELRMNFEEIKHCVEKAHSLGFKISSHTENSQGVYYCLKAGVDTIEHGAPLNQEMLELLRNGKSKIVATFSPSYPTVALPLEDSKYTQEQQKATKIVYDGIASSARACYENDIPVGLGTDASCPFSLHSTMWREICFYQKAVGCTNLEALRAGTLGNAEILGLDEVTGSIGVGKDADLLLVKENPLDNLKTLSHPVAVFAKGQRSTKKRKHYKKVEKLLDSLL